MDVSGERIVPELADAIEGRRRQLGLSVGQLARAADLTTEGLRPLRRGEARDYQERTVLNLCRALKWTPDSIDRVLRGESPVEDGDAAPVGNLEERVKTLEFIERDATWSWKQANALEKRLDALQEAFLRHTHFNPGDGYTDEPEPVNAAETRQERERHDG